MDGANMRVGRWRLGRQLGAGGMGTVYLGTSGDVLAAVKLISPSLANDPVFRRRFEREVAICRRVKGKQVAELIDADPMADRPWLAVRYVPGPTLNEAVNRNGPMSGETLRGFSVAIAEALRQIHASGVFHRDLKPSNVILTPSSPVLIDFGIAAATEATSLTMTGTAMGSPGWMAPEQIRGEPTGAPSDVFAWGVVVAYAATGHNPFGEGRPEALAYRVVHGEPDLSDVPYEVRPLVAASLSRDPLERPTVDELLAELTGEPGGTIAETTIASTWIGESVDAFVATAHGADPVTRARHPVFGRVGGIMALLIVLTFLVVTLVFISNQKDDRTGRALGSEPNLGDDVEEVSTTTRPAGTSSTVATSEVTSSDSVVKPQEQSPALVDVPEEDGIVLSAAGLGGVRIRDPKGDAYLEFSRLFGEPTITDMADCEPQATLMKWEEQGITIYTDAEEGMFFVQIYDPGPGMTVADIRTTGGMRIRSVFPDVYRQYNSGLGKLVDYGYNDVSEEWDFAIESGPDEGVSGTYEYGSVRSMSLGSLPLCNGMGGM